MFLYLRPSPILTTFSLLSPSCFTSSPPVLLPSFLPSLPVFLRSHKSLESVDPQFTMRRKMEQLREELELMEQLRDVRPVMLRICLNSICRWIYEYKIVRTPHEAPVINRRRR